MFMAIYAQECFPSFKETVEAHFESDDISKHWSLNLGFKNNVVRIWQKIENYKQIPYLKTILIWFVHNLKKPV